MKFCCDLNSIHGYISKMSIIHVIKQYALIACYAFVLPLHNPKPFKTLHKH